MHSSPLNNNIVFVFIINQNEKFTIWKSHLIQEHFQLGFLLRPEYCVITLKAPWSNGVAHKHVWGLQNTFNWWSHNLLHKCMRAIPQLVTLHISKLQYLILLLHHHLLISIHNHVYNIEKNEYNWTNITVTMVTLRVG